jgi:hypothetical protein
MEAFVFGCVRGNVKVSSGVPEPAEALSRRGQLPGAFGYDRAAHLFRTLQAEGSDAVDLLPAAFPASWMVNAKATSRTFVHWTAAEPVWSELLGLLRFDLSTDEWPGMAEADRKAVSAAVTTLSGVPGASVCAVTKVLALLRPQLVPLMDDAAIWFATGGVSEPATADAPSAGPEHFVPMMDWFAEEAKRSEPALVELARTHTLAVLDAPQVLDRLLWWASWGHRIFEPKAQ